MSTHRRQVLTYGALTADFYRGVAVARQMGFTQIGQYSKTHTFAQLFGFDHDKPPIAIIVHPDRMGDEPFMVPEDPAATPPVWTTLQLGNQAIYASRKRHRSNAWWRRALTLRTHGRDVSMYR